MIFLERALKIQKEIQDSPLENIGFQTLDSKQHSSVRISEIIDQSSHDIEGSLKNRLRDEFQGFGPISDLMNDPEVTEIILNSRCDIWFEKKGTLECLTDGFISDLTFDNFMHRLCTEAKVQTSLEVPFTNGRIADFRLHIASAEMTGKSPALTMRRLRQSAFDFQDLEKSNWSSKEGIQILKQWILEHKNFLVIGETGSGKTSLLNTCLQEISSHERAVIIEDTDEIIVPNKASLKLLTRQQNPHLTTIDMTELVKQSLRMRPDRLIVGEVRSGEAKDLVLALSTGHRGSMGTLHASSPQQALIRLEMLVQLGAPHWNLAAIRRLIGLSLDGIVTVTRTRCGKRRLKSISMITSVEDTGILLDTMIQENFE